MCLNYFPHPSVSCSGTFVENIIFVPSNAFCSLPKIGISVGICVGFMWDYFWDSVLLVSFIYLFFQISHSPDYSV